MTSRGLPRPLTRRSLRDHDHDRGSAAIEAAIVVPALGLFIALIIAGGRITMAHQAVEAAATEAARTASISRTHEGASRDAYATANATLTNHDLRCTTTQVNVDTTGFAQSTGTPAAVTATVTCQVNLSDLAIPGLPGTRTITATMTSPIDTYRER